SDSALRSRCSSTPRWCGSCSFPRPWSCSATATGGSRRPSSAFPRSKSKANLTSSPRRRDHSNQWPAASETRASPRVSSVCGAIRAGAAPSSQRVIALTQASFDAARSSDSVLFSVGGGGRSCVAAGDTPGCDAERSGGPGAQDREAGPGRELCGTDGGFDAEEGLTRVGGQVLGVVPQGAGELQKDDGQHQHEADERGDGAGGAAEDGAEAQSEQR